MSLVFFISGHGFGHASRQVEIINAFGVRRPDAAIIIRSAVSPSLLERTVRVPYALRPGPCDVGIVQASSVSHDDPATVRAAIDFYATFGDRIAREVDALANDDVELIVADIPPIAFEVAARLECPSVAIANFTWDWIYETHPGMAEAAPDLVPRLRSAYAKATLALELPFSGGFDVFPHVQPLPLVARHPTRTRDETRAHFGIPADRPAVLLSFGGYGLPALPLAGLDCLGRWTVVTTDRVAPSGPGGTSGVVMVEESAFQTTGFRYEDLVAAVDAVATKPGFGIIAECIAAGTAMLYTSRGAFREYDTLVAALPQFVRSRFISQDELFAGRILSALTGLLAQSPPAETMATDGAVAAAAQLDRLVQVRT